ncbi:hypothetical protein JSE7799_03717 [Jannaschia seosinensis]|uniref:Uncharacterized protein n=1 Tax=Jannaschia seosinensis TaxID=313367 RepID=A0A0M7BHZ7_9RHOB|nr:hypothetical protein [Jannaschia seosinensis]CUH40976.1 hypothetical protein JSE7799_03717 [Jannaschia seosinensis]
MAQTHRFRLLPPEDLWIDQSIAIQPGAHHHAALQHAVLHIDIGAQARVGIERRVCGLLLGGFDVIEIDQAVLGEIGVDRHIEEPALIAVGDIRRPGDRLGKAALLGKAAQAARLFGDQQRAVGQVRHAPRILERRQLLDPERSRARQNGVGVSKGGLRRSSGYSCQSKCERGGQKGRSGHRSLPM